MRVIIFVVAALALAACGKAGGYPPQYGTNFIASCQSSGAPPVQCQCLWDKIEAEVPVDDFVAMDSAVSAGQPHPLTARMTEFSAQCLASNP